jgi:hypothetical protein
LRSCVDGFEELALGVMQSRSWVTQSSRSNGPGRDDDHIEPTPCVIEVIGFKRLSESVEAFDVIILPAKLS